MNIKILDKESRKAYLQILKPDIAENIGRKGYYGIVTEQGDGVLVWKQNRAGGQAKILLYTAEDVRMEDALMEEYENRLKSEGITKSESELPVMSGASEKEALVRHGYTLSKGESSILHTTVSYLAALPAAARCELPQTIKSVGTLNLRQFSQGIRTLQGTGTSEDIQALSPAWFDPALSACVQTEGRVCGYLLIHRLPSGTLKPELFSVTEPAGRKELLDMIRYVIFQAEDLLGGDTGVAISRSNESVRALTDKLLPGLKGEEVFTASKIFSEKGA